MLIKWGIININYMDINIYGEPAMFQNTDSKQCTIGDQIGKGGMFNINKAIKELEAYNLKQYLLKWLKENETT